MRHEIELCNEHIEVFCTDLDMRNLGWEPGDSANIHVVTSEGCEMCRLVSRETEVICTECGNDLVCEGHTMCSACLESS